MRNHDRLKRLLRIMALITILASMFLAVYVTLPDVSYRTLAGRLQPWPFRMGCLMLIVIGPGALVRVSAALPLILVSYAEYWASAHSGTSGHGSGLPLVTAGGGWFAFILVLVYAPAFAGAVDAVRSPRRRSVQAGCCARCGYGLKGQLHCPECGTSFDPTASAGSPKHEPHASEQ